MSSFFSDANSEFDHASMASTLRASSSQSSRASMETPFDSTLGPDSLQHSLASSWASYLSAQHSSRELGALKRSVNEQIDVIKACTSSLQQEASRQQELVAESLSEFKAQSQRTTSDLNRLKPLQDSLPALRQEIRAHSEQGSRSLGELADRFSALQDRVDGMDSLVSKDMQTVQDRYGTALKMIEFLQGELKGVTAEKIALERKLTAVERKVETMAEAHSALPEATVSFLTSLFSRRDDLTKLLDQPQVPIARPDAESSPLPRATTPVPGKGGHTRRREKGSPKVPRKRKRGPSNTQNLGTLLSRYKQEYKAHPPTSDVTFIWSFIDDIDDPALSKHIQEWLASTIPGLVTPKRELRSKGGHRHITIQPGLTWKEFQKAVVKTPPLKE